MDIQQEYIFVGGSNDGLRQKLWSQSNRFITLPKRIECPVKWTRYGVEPAKERVDAERYELTVLRIGSNHIQFYRIEGMSEYAALLLILARYPKQTKTE